jgi:predicted alpha/beta superfamily hydrolase
MQVSPKHYLVFGAALLLPMMIAMRALAQSDPEFKPIPAETITIASKILNEKRKIYIYTPAKDSLNTGKRYPVLYVMDGDNHFGMIAEYCRYLSRPDVNVMPEMIVVGVANTNRTRDLTPTHSIINYYGKPDTSSTSWLKPSGGNEQFFQFIQNELFPYIKSNYKTQPFSIFAGHSFGGITAINCLLTHPEMFNAYIAVSPSFWWDKEYLLKLADKKLQKGSTLNKILFYSVASEGVADKSSFQANVLTFDSLLAKRQIVGLDHKYVYYPEDIHMTEPITAYYDALRFIYKQWDLPEQDDKQVNSSVITKHYQQLSQRYGYTILPGETAINNWALYLAQNTGTVDNAISLFEMNTVNYPRSYKAFTNLGDAWLKKGVKEKAVINYKKALEINPLDTGLKEKIRMITQGK